MQSELILLIKSPMGLQSTGRRPGDFVPLEILLSNWTFMGEPAWFDKDAHLSWATSIGGAPLNNGTSSVSDVAIAQGETGPVAAFGVDVPQVATASKILVNVTLYIAGKTFATNQWTLAVWPALEAKKCAVPVFTEPGMLIAAQAVCSNAAAVPSSLGLQSSPFVLLRQGGLSEDDVAALGRTGGFGLALNPDSGGWPVCGQSSIGSVGRAKVAFAQPWWMSTGTTGTLVYSNAFTKSLGFGTDDGFLDYSWMNLVDGGQAFTLDDLVHSTVHIRAIPVDGAYGGAYTTTISNDAIVWEGRIPAATAIGGADEGRFLVSGFNLVDGSKLSAEPAAEFVFDRLLSYVVSETATVRTVSAVEPMKFDTGTVPAAVNAKAKACNVSGSFCPAGSEKPCQGQTVSANVCNHDFEIITPVCLQEDATL